MTSSLSAIKKEVSINALLNPHMRNGKLPSHNDRRYGDVACRGSHSLTSECFRLSPSPQICRASLILIVTGCVKNNGTLLFDNLTCPLNQRTFYTT